MLINKISLQNVRSFLERQELNFDGPISIVIGPNGGGKTNLLDTLVIMLRKHLLATKYEQPINTENGTRWQLVNNQSLDHLTFEKHHNGQHLEQIVELEVKISKSDIENMKLIKLESVEVRALIDKIYHSDPWAGVQNWKIEEIHENDLITYVWKNGAFQQPSEKPAYDFLQYLQIFEFDNKVRYDLQRSPLQLPLVYLPVNRASGGFQSGVSLANYDDISQKKSFDATFSRNSPSIISLAIGRLGQKYRVLLENSNQDAKKVFYADKNLKLLSATLKDLGYEWELTTVNINTNEYDVRLKKQGTTFAVSAASSGERELLTYLFAIYALNVRDAVIVVDEPELHLHPRWQKKLFDLFLRLSNDTGNQFILATHSPTFISPASIQYVSRIYSDKQRSRIIRLQSSDLPEAKHLFNLVNSQNNERLFFTDRVLLVEGLSDRIFFEKVFTLLAERHNVQFDYLEILSVGGKGLFPAYNKLLSACHVEHDIIADLDYVEQIGDETVKSLFVLNSGEIKKDVIDNIKSIDADTLVQRIEDAIKTGVWNDADETWQYIKSRRIQLSSNLTDDQKNVLFAFIHSKHEHGIYILREGALENYLPIGFKSKNIEHLITFLASEDFWEKLPLPNRNEIESIVKRILGLSDQKL